MPLLLQPPALPLNGISRRRWCGLHGAASGLALANAASTVTRVLLVITPDAASARQIQAEMQFFGNAGLSALNFPAWETLPYDNFSPHQDIVSERLATLAALQTGQRCALVLPVASLMNRLPPADFIGARVLDLALGQIFEPRTLRARLEASGYRSVDTVTGHGEYTLRGSVMDIYPAGSDLPCRIDVFDDTIESLRYFDPETQRTVTKTERIQLLPAREFPLDKSGINHFLDRWHERFPDSQPRQCALYQDIRDGLAAPGAEYFLPLFFKQCGNLLDYLPEGSQVVQLGAVHAAAEKYQQEIRNRYENMHISTYRPLLKPHEAFLPVEELFAGLRQHHTVDILPDESGDAGDDFNSQPLPDIALSARDADPLLHLHQLLETHPACRLLVAAESAGRAEALFTLFAKHGLPLEPVSDWAGFMDGAATRALVQAPLDRSLWLPADNLLLLSESQLFGHQILQKRRRQKQSNTSDDAILHLSELSPGAPVVHIEHGVGRYQGLTTLDIGGDSGEFLHLRYAGEASLYVPVGALHLVSRYQGADPDQAPWHRLGSEQWQKTREKAARQVEDIAAKLLDLHARRAARSRMPFTLPDIEFNQFCNEFPFEETPDQSTAIEAVVHDLCGPQPMDRLVCGDVGFGKTEVAMRAAFIAAINQRQVAILVPTTLLAQQHADNFRDRFAAWPISIESISRFRSAKEQDAVLAQAAEGKIDILIGTHRLLQKDVRFKQLGLLIIDEEHRFGVKQKEQMKALRAEVDILTLTATPIPRTLNMAMAGMRDMSIIATPPARRLAIKTFVRQQDEGTVKEAILRELLRGGQVYYLHNNVASIHLCADQVRALVPEARVVIGHGQMRERELEQVMTDFYHQRFNVLVCTTIIETGIDVPNANTIILERADKFGLAQLHQLRGRVGRSHHQAYAYLLTPDARSLTADAEKRLEAISHADTLGAGFLLANHDLEIRGAGELLGESQSGQIESIGFSLYMDMLERAVKALREGKDIHTELEWTPAHEINLRVPAFIPDDYLPDAATRLVLYRRIACAVDAEALRELQVEMIDRFGLLPGATRNLFRQTGLRQQLGDLGISKLEAGHEGLKVDFSKETRVDPFTLVQLMQQDPQRYKLVGGKQLQVKQSLPDDEDRFNAVDALLGALSKPA
jgi:transcription-repair coupling factor (superfamily II helicase)